MVEQSADPNSTANTPSKDASEPINAPSVDASEVLKNSDTGYGFSRPSFSYLNAINMAPGTSQTSSLVESPRPLASLQPMASCLSTNMAPAFSCDDLHSSDSPLGAQSASMVIEQGHSGVGMNASSAASSVLSPAAPFTSHPRPFMPAVHAIGPPCPLPVAILDQNFSVTGNVSLDRSVHPNQNNPSLIANLRADGTQEVNAKASGPTFTRPASQLAHTNLSTSATPFISNNQNNSSMWMSSPPAFQAPIGMPGTPVTPGTPGIIAPAFPPIPSITSQPSAINTTVLPRNFMPVGPVLPNPPIQHQTVTPYISPSPQSAPPGLWLQSQQVSGPVRSPITPYADHIPGPYPIHNHAVAPLFDVQPPGVFPLASSIGGPMSFVSSGGHSAITSMQAELPPGTESSKHAGNDQIHHESSSKKHLDAWATHWTETGTEYYYNALTGESTYAKPNGFKGESDKTTVQPIPVSWEKMSGTDWTLVTTNNGKKYYYNSTTKLSSWQIPNELIEIQKKQTSDSLKAQSVSGTNTNVVTEKGSGPSTLSTPAADNGGRESTTLRPSNASGSSSALDLIKKKLQDSGTPDNTPMSAALSGAIPLELNGSKSNEATIKGSQNENSREKRKDGNGDLSDTSSDSEDEDRGPSKEEYVFQFKEMLKERGVAPFSKWEKELPKIVFDPRFKAIPSHSARRAIFDHYVRTRAEEERKEKRAAQKAALDGFKQLLEEAKEDIDHNTDYQSFKKRWGEDPRFQALDRKEKEILLNERVLPLKRDAYERAQAVRTAATSSFKSMLQDNRDINSNSRWYKVKDGLKSDPRYKSVNHEDREKLFNEYIAERKAAEEEMERKSRAQKDEEEKLKERERALRKRKEREEQEVERVRLKARRKEAVESYQALLVETIKDFRASWTESKPKLEKDPQGRSANPHLDKSDLEKHFREHVKSLHERCALEFRALLTEVVTAEAATQDTQEGKTIINSWSTAKQLLKSDPRYKKMRRKERESLWHRHAEEIQRKLKSMNDQDAERHAEPKTRNSVDSGKHVSGSRRTHEHG
ncbi:pre-mRNA-processing protein 40C [Dorcoceras hygrometricum]|uniref:Pre-mRNA-processing protein 40C n=1 Tax=Dorcoceras hygrometricum TaxID=472368 RepID=A0A2Z7B230_9LAMI|nr:pre-mRNA-processing protein 40C [Dorcoceras hygrometricum]